MVDLAEIQAAYYMVAATGVLVAAIFYILNLRVSQRNMKATLQTRKLQLATSLADNLFNEEGFQRYCELMNMEWKDYDDFEKKYGSDFNPDNYAKRTTCSYTFNMVGTLLKEKLVEPEMLYDMGMIGASFIWYKFDDVLLDQRKRYMGADHYVNFELLAKEMMRIKVERDPSYKMPKTFLMYVPEK